MHHMLKQRPSSDKGGMDEERQGLKKVLKCKQYTPGCIFVVFRHSTHEQRSLQRSSLVLYERGYPPWSRQWARVHSLLPSQGRHRWPTRQSRL